VTVGRYAPSPTGTFHIGNLRTAVLAWLCARQSGSAFLLRWDDLDVTAAAEHEATQRRDLAALGIDFDGDEMRQTDRIDVYRSVIEDLRAAGRTYRCWCSRREIREAAAAPHTTVGVYPGTCRDLSSAETQEREAQGRPPALRLRTEIDVRPFIDTQVGDVIGAIDDFVLQRGDGTPAYNLAVVVDDIEQGVEEVVRASDLLDSTGRQAHLYDHLGTSEPVWTHVPLCVDDSGDRLAKRDGSLGLDAWRAAGGTVATLLEAMAVTFGMPGGERPDSTSLLDGFDRDRLPQAPSMLSSSGARLSLRH
jgi:glutamyl-tRNA synthetase